VITGWAGGAARWGRWGRLRYAPTLDHCLGYRQVPVAPTEVPNLFSAQSRHDSLRAGVNGEDFPVAPVPRDQRQPAALIDHKNLSDHTVTRHEGGDLFHPCPFLIVCVWVVCDATLMIPVAGNFVNPLFCDLVVVGQVGKGFHQFNELMETFRSEEHTSELQSRENLVCRLLLEKKKL